MCEGGEGGEGGRRRVRGEVCEGGEEEEGRRVTDSEGCIYTCNVNCVQPCICEP